MEQPQPMQQPQPTEQPTEQQQPTEQPKIKIRTDQVYYGRALLKIRRVQFAVFVFTVLFIIFSMIFFKDDITFDNFRYLMRYIEISPPAISDGERSIRFSASAETDFAVLGERLIVANPKSIFSYDTGGRRILNEELDFQNPVFVSNGKYVLAYEPNGYALSVFNAFSEVYEKRFSTPIEYVYLADNGAFAVITREKTYNGGVIAFNNRFQQVFSMMTRTASVTDVCFDGKSMLACATTDVQGGDYYSEIYLFDVNADEKTPQQTAEASDTLVGELPLNLFCTGKGFALMIDSGIHYYDAKGKAYAFSGFELDTPRSFYRFDSFFAVTLKSALASTDTRVKVFDDAGNLLLTDDFSNDVVHIDASDGNLYLLGSFGVKHYTYDDHGVFSEGESLELPGTGGEYRRVFALEENRCLLVSADGAVCVTAGGADDGKGKNEPDGGSSPAA